MFLCFWRHLTVKRLLHLDFFLVQQPPFVYGRWLLSKSKYDEQFLVIAGQLAVCRLAEIAGVRFLSVYQQHGRANLAAVLQDRHLQERQRGRHAPAAVGVQTAGMVSFIISPHRNML